MKIFIDDGSTSIKLQWEQDGEIKQLAVPTSFKRGWKADFGSESVVNYSIDGEKYSFDKQDTSALNTTHIEWQYSNINTIAIHHALLQSNIKPQAVDIVVTLPLSEFYDKDNQTNEKNISRKKTKLLQRISTNKNTPLFSFSSITVRPESIPAGFDLLTNIDENQSLLIIDLGGTTIDISQISGQMSDIIAIKGDSTLGVSLVTEEVKTALLKANTYASNFIAEKFIIHRDDNEFFEKNINDNQQIPIVKTALNDAIRRLNDRVIDVIRDFRAYHYVMIIGGGAYLIKDKVKSHTQIREDRFFISVNPQFDLVNGMFHLG